MTAAAVPAPAPVRAPAPTGLLVPRPLPAGDGPLPGRPVAPPPGAPPQLWLLRASEQPLRPDSATPLRGEEAARRARFVHPRDRHRYTAGRLGLRRLLGAYLGQEPDEVVFVRQPCTVCGGPSGRPAPAVPGLHFSLSRSADLVLYAVGRTPVGVDVEASSPTDVDDAVRDLLHPQERAELDALAPAERREAFLRCWTRKEAYLKGIGAGLAHGIDRNYLGTGAFPPSRPPATGWTVLDVDAGEGGHAAVAFSATLYHIADGQ
ncbi:4'-phosphopantetheinyl transferase superfamily protein [Streptomyces sp. NPDC006326]|uniref:4'-phosphopantetheinyl transferase family protein n=1 Tax=Streptomyces sp. NPDC006326 TaxID=3156752 RepID=UPI0033AACA7A